MPNKHKERPWTSERANRSKSAPRTSTRATTGAAPCPALGIMGVDFEERVDYRRLHRYRLGRAKQALENSDLGALLVFDVNNIRYITSTKIGEWERDKLSRWALLTRDSEPILWDFGSAAVHHKLYTPWLKPENCKAGLIGLRGTVTPAFGLMKRHAEEIASLIREAGVGDMPVGVDIIEPPMMFELQKAGLKIEDGQQVMLEAREIKSMDEIALLNRAAAMVDGAYHLINEQLKPGVRENDIVAEVNKFLYTHGSDDVEAINAISGERCNPHPHNFTDRMLRPGRPGVLRYPAVVHGLSHLLLPHLQCRPRHAGAARRLQEGARMARQRDRAHQAGRDHRAYLRGVPESAASSASRTRCRPSACSSRTVSASRCTSGRSSRAWCRWITRPRSRKAWCSRSRPIARRPTASRPRASRKRSWSPTRAAA